MVQKLITPITLEEYFPPKFFDKRMMTSIHMVSCYETLENVGLSEDEASALSAKSRKAKEENEVVASL